MPRQEKWPFFIGESTLFLAFSRNPNSCEQERHLDAELPPDATELESTRLARLETGFWMYM